MNLRRRRSWAPGYPNSRAAASRLACGLTLGALLLSLAVVVPVFAAESPPAPGELSETLVAPLLHPPNMPSNRVPGLLHHIGMGSLELVLGG